MKLILIGLLVIGFSQLGNAETKDPSHLSTNLNNLIEFTFGDSISHRRDNFNYGLDVERSLSPEITIGVFYEVEETPQHPTHLYGVTMNRWLFHEWKLTAGIGKATSGSDSEALYRTSLGYKIKGLPPAFQITPTLIYDLHKSGPTTSIDLCFGYHF